MSPFILMDLHTSPPPVHPPTLLIVSVVKQVNRTLPPGVCVSKLCHFWQFSYSAEEVVPWIAMNRTFWSFVCLSSGMGLRMATKIHGIVLSNQRVRKGSVLILIILSLSEDNNNITRYGGWLDQGKVGGWDYGNWENWEGNPRKIKWLIIALVKVSTTSDVLWVGVLEKEGSEL